MVERVESIPALVRDVSGRQYIPSDRLGAGGFATCWRAKMVDRREDLERPECALKVVKARIRTQTLSQRFQVELQVHSKLRHSNVVQFLRAFTYQENTFIVLELCQNGSLADMVKRRRYLTMGEIRRFLIQLCGAVKYLHTRDIVHRDIKAGNIFLDSNMNIKLGDFGLSAVMVSAGAYIRRTTFCGTPNYLAPEVLNRDGSGHGASVDIWAVGVMAYYMSVGRAPFHSKSREEIYEKLKTGDYAWPELSPDANEIPQDLKALVATLLVPESQRPTPDCIVGHAFFHGFVPDKLEPLVLSRRPKWARIGGERLQSSKRAYEKLCRDSQVGPGAPMARKAKSIVKAIAEELSSGQAQLRIPLPERTLYLGLSQKVERRAPVCETVVEEASSEADLVELAVEPVKELAKAPVPDPSKDSMKPPQRPIRAEPLRERSSNKQTARAPDPTSKQSTRAPRRPAYPTNLMSEHRLKRPRRAGVNYGLNE